MAYSIAKPFIDHSYTPWGDQSRRPELKALDKPYSTLSFESSTTNFTGEAIYDGVFSFIGHATTRHEIASIDVQGEKEDMIVLVTGRVSVGDSEEPLYFSEAFQLKDEGRGLYIFRDIIRLTKLQ